MPVKSYGPNVRRGAERLDEYEPGWANEINIRRLKMSSPYKCIVGQLNSYTYSPYSRGVEELNVRGMEAQERNGYNIDCSAMTVKETQQAFARLRRAWIVEIKKRRAVKKTKKKR